jgi:hypothetical protein
VSFIDTGDHHWLNFDLTDKAKLDLSRRGADEAMRFLCRVDSDNSKADRRRLAGGLRAMRRRRSAPALPVRCRAGATAARRNDGSIGQPLCVFSEAGRCQAAALLDAATPQ